MKSVERFGPEWCPLAKSLAELEDSPEANWWSDPRQSISVGEGEGADRTIRLKGDFKLGRISFRQPNGRLFDSLHISILNETEPDPDAWGAFSDYQLFSLAWYRARSVFIELRDELARQIAYGSLTAAGRLVSPFAEPTILAPDAWAHLQVQDWFTGKASGPDDATVFSLHVKKDDGGAVHDAAMVVGRVTKVELVARVLATTLPGSELSSLSAKELGRRIEPAWRMQHPNASLPSDDTISRARRLSLGASSSANDA